MLGSGWCWEAGCTCWVCRELNRWMNVHSLSFPCSLPPLPTPSPAHLERQPYFLVQRLKAVQQQLQLSILGRRRGPVTKKGGRKGSHVGRGARAPATIAGCCAAGPAVHGLLRVQRSIGRRVLRRSMPRCMPWPAVDAGQRRSCHACSLVHAQLRSRNSWQRVERLLLRCQGRQRPAGMGCSCAAGASSGGSGRSGVVHPAARQQQVGQVICSTTRGGVARW